MYSWYPHVTSQWNVMARALASSHAGAVSERVDLALVIGERVLDSEVPHPGGVETRDEALHQLDVLLDLEELTEKHDVVDRERADDVVLG